MHPFSYVTNRISIVDTTLISHEYRFLSSLPACSNYTNGFESWCIANNRFSSLSPTPLHIMSCSLPPSFRTGQLISLMNGQLVPLHRRHISKRAITSHLSLLLATSIHLIDL